MSRASSGMGSFETATSQPRWSYEDRLVWARRNFPEEEPGYVVLAAQLLAFGRYPVTVETTWERLVAMGRSRAQLAEVVS